jgi:hypothetical protein
LSDQIYTEPVPEFAGGRSATGASDGIERSRTG